MLLFDLVAHPLYKMRFTQANLSVYEKRIVSGADMFHDGLRRGVKVSMTTSSFASAPYSLAYDAEFAEKGLEPSVFYIGG